MIREVWMSRKIDMGKQFPLRLTVWPHASYGVWAILLMVLFLVVPVGYLMDQGWSKLNWIFVLFIGVGFLGLYWAVFVFTTYCSYRIDEKEVVLNRRRFFKHGQEREKLSEYRALITPTYHGAGFLGRRNVYSIVLWHKTETLKQIPLFTTNNQKKLKERIRLLEKLFHLPVNPAGLDLAEIPNGMPLEFFHKQGG